MYKGDRLRKETLVEYGFRLPSALDNRPLRFEEFERLSGQTVFISATPGPRSWNVAPARWWNRRGAPSTGLIDPETEVRLVRRRRSMTYWARFASGCRRRSGCWSPP